MDRSKIVAVLTGIISLILGIAYLLVVQFLDFRGEMVPAPQDLSYLPHQSDRPALSQMITQTIEPLINSPIL